jgi:acetyltransferase
MMNTQTNIETFYTESGLPVWVRYLQPEDAPFLVNLFEHMSGESRYRRFNQALETPPADRVWAEAENIALGVATHSVGLIAFMNLQDQIDAPVAAVRYVLINEKEAEVALSVRDDMQNQGIGRRLLQRLIAEAKEAGLQRLVGSVQNDNHAVWGMLKHIAEPIDHVLEGTVTAIVIHLQPAGQAPEPILTHPDFIG